MKKIINRKNILLALGAIILVAAGVWCWNRYFSPTRIAFVNYQVLTLGQISKANDNPTWIKISDLPADRLDDASDYDMIFVNAMGLRITAEQREHLIKAANSGTPVLTTAVTNPDNYILSVDSLQAAEMGAYLTGSGRTNFRNLLNYVRRNVDRKIVSAPAPGEVVEAATEMMYHADLDDPSREDVGFNSVADYKNYLREKGRLREGAPEIIVCGWMGDPTDLVAALEESGNNVYVVRDILTFIRAGHADSIAPKAVVNMAHGRMGDFFVDYLRQRNIPMFAPINVNRLESEWLDDKMGMNGGFMSQSIITPEIDGAIRPYALFANRENSDGLQEQFTMPRRLDQFVNTVNNYIALSSKPNSEKKLAIVYFKGPGQNALVASGMEVVPSLYNLLCRLRDEGYRVDGLPASADELSRMIQQYGPVFGTYSEGEIANFLRNGNPLTISRSDYEKWASEILEPESYAEVTAQFGDFPGKFMAISDSTLAVARLQFGNVVILPQPAAGGGDDSFAMVHGTDAAPPHAYLAPYLWIQKGFGADALIHFGTHGGLEYTPRKQVALSNLDWPDRLVGELPHFYIYTIGNVGEGMIAKRRTYAGLQTYLTPPFIESSLRNVYRELNEAIKTYNNLLEQDDAQKLTKAAADVRRHTERLGIGRELGFDSLSTEPYSEADVARVEQFAEELANEKIVGQLYTMGVPYDNANIESSVRSMTIDPLAYSLLALDKLRGKAPAGIDKHKTLFTARYLDPARQAVDRLISNPSSAGDALVCSFAAISPDELAEAREIEALNNRPAGMPTMILAMSGTPVNQQRAADERRQKMREMAKHISPEKALALAKKMGAPAAALISMEAALKGDSADASTRKNEAKMLESTQPEITKEQLEKSRAILNIERAINNVGNYRRALQTSPEAELASIVNALNGGFTAPSPGGDPIVNPNTLPTGRNLYGVNTEATPSESAWEKGKQLAENTIKLYRERHNDSIPRKVSYTLWSGEFIETEGATIAQVLYMLGVEPVRDAFGRVTDLRLIPSAELGRPRIDVVVQTSGQLRDLAASRLFLINRAVEMAAAAGNNEEFVNQVSLGAVEAEQQLTAKGLSPREAREVALYRVFGGVNGNYGTGIQGMIQASDKWDDEKSISDVYLNNMGAFYGKEDQWEAVRQYAFEAALGNTDAVVQPRQSNTWGALSLDHVYEFMGGLNLAVRNVTGKDPDAYLSDYRNHNNMRMQEVKEAIGVESRSTIFNPTYIKERMKGGASSAGELSEIVNNTFGWNVAKPAAIDNEMWDEIYDVYVGDKHNLGVLDFYERENPAAMQDVSATMLESARKGMWNASPDKIAALAKLHSDLVEKYGPSGSERVMDNAKLRDFISQQLSAEQARQYRENIDHARNAAVDPGSDGMVMKKETLSTDSSSQRTLSTVVIIAIVFVILAVVAVVVRRRRKNNETDTWKQQS